MSSVLGSSHLISGTMTLLPTSDPADVGPAAASEERNASGGAGCPLPQLGGWLVAALPAYMLLVAALGVALNVFVMAVLLLHQKARSVAEIYLSNMAAADFLLSACLPFWAAYAANGFDWTAAPPLCALVTLSISVNAHCSIYFLVLIGVDRYVALVHPLSRAWIRRPAAARGGCVLVWGVGVALSAPTLLYREVVYSNSSHTHLCRLSYPSAAALRVSEGAQVALGFLLPALVLSACSARILRALRRRVGRSSRRAEHRATRLVLAVLVAFAACWLPFHAVKALYLLVYAEVLTGCSLLSALHTCGNIFMYLAFSNSVLNPILYVIVGNNFRKKVSELFRRPSGGRAALGTTFTRSAASRSFRTTEASR